MPGTNSTSELPAVRVRLDGKTLRAKFPLPKARWHGKYPEIGAVVKAAWEAGVPQHFAIHYVTEEE
jgi:hypothetical protein